jgi:hypothetical protein
MKRMSVALVALIVAAIGVHAAVTSVNIVGYNSVALEPGQRIIMSAPLYDPSGDGTNTLISVFGTDQLVQSDYPTSADRVALWDTVTSSYQYYAQWTDGHFYKANTADEWNDGILADDDVIPAGASFWLIHPAASPSSEISILGEVKGGSSDTQEVAIAIGYQLSASPYAAEIAIQDIAKIADGATPSDYPTSADRIVTWDPVAQAYQTYALWTDDSWYKANTADEWNDGIAATGTVPISGGFWYISQTGFTLADACPYSAAY